MRKRHHLALLALLALGLLAGCASATARIGGPTPTGTSATSTATANNPTHAPRDFCALVAPGEVGTAIGAAVQPPQGHISVDANIGPDADGPRSFTKLAACRYNAISGPALVALGYYYGLAPEIAGVYTYQRALAPHAQAVAGLGDAAYWDGATLSLLSASVFAQVSVQNAADLAPGSAALLAAERRIALVIVARL